MALAWYAMKWRGSGADIERSQFPDWSDYRRGEILALTRSAL